MSAEQNQPRKPAGTAQGGQWAPAPHAEPDIELDTESQLDRKKTYEVSYTISTSMSHSDLVSSGETVVVAVDEAEAARLAVDWVHEHDPYCDPRVDPYVEVTSVMEADDDYEA